MSNEIKPMVAKSETFDLLEVRLGRIISAVIEPSASKKAYKMEIDFGKFGKKISVGRFTQHSVEEIVGKLVLGVLNLGVIEIGEIRSEVLILGVQYPKADSGEAVCLQRK